MVVWMAYPLVRVRFDNRSGIESFEGPFIFVCNHRSSSDPFLMSVLPASCNVVQVVNKWPFKLPVIGIYARLAGYLDINSMPAEEFNERAGKLLGQNVSIIFFPEGTRSGGTSMGPFHGTAFRLFLGARVPIVPICISGNENIPHKGSLVLNPGRVNIRMLPPIRWEDCRDMKAYKVKTLVKKLIEDELVLMDEAA
jgi:1-acyl-sn-glycerol-3-phosphate acyltransferase